MASLLKSPFRQSFGYVLCLILSFESFVFCQAPIGTAFNIKQGTTNGGCANYLTQLDGIWADCWSLVNNAIDLIQAAQSTNAAQVLETFQAQELIFTFFGTRAAVDYADALRMFFFHFQPSYSPRNLPCNCMVLMNVTFS
jgi:hypothetical protein